MATPLVPLHIFITLVLLRPDPIVTDNKTHNVAHLVEKRPTLRRDESKPAPPAPPTGCGPGRPAPRAGSCRPARSLSCPRPRTFEHVSTIRRVTLPSPPGLPPVTGVQSVLTPRPANTGARRPRGRSVAQRGPSLSLDTAPPRNSPSQRGVRQRSGSRDPRAHGDPGEGTEPPQGQVTGPGGIVLKP